jgi:hypothetical protein
VTKAAAAARGVELTVVEFTGLSYDLRAAFEIGIRAGVDGFVPFSSAGFQLRRAELSELILQYRLPTIGPGSMAGDPGILVSYHPDIPRQGAAGRRDRRANIEGREASRYPGRAARCVRTPGQSKAGTEAGFEDSLRGDGARDRGHRMSCTTLHDDEHVRAGALSITPNYRDLTVASLLKLIAPPVVGDVGLRPRLCENASA